MEIHSPYFFVGENLMTKYELTADIDGQHHKISYEVGSDDAASAFEEESFNINTERSDVYDRMPEDVIRKLEEILHDEAVIGRYLEKIVKAESMSDMIDIRHEYMKDANFPHRLVKRFNTALLAKVEEIDKKSKDSMITRKVKYER